MVQKLAEDRAQNSLALENTQKRLLDVRKSSQQLRETLEELQSKIDKSRVDLAQLQIELEKERYWKVNFCLYASINLVKPILSSVPLLSGLHFTCLGLREKEQRRM